MRVVLITVIPAVAQGYAQIVRALGHEPVAVISARRRSAGAPQLPLVEAMAADAPDGLDVVFPESKRSLAPLLRAYAADLAICTGYPWLVPGEAIAAPRLGIVNGHPSLLPRYRGPFPVAWAVRNGETEIGFTYHLMDEAFDTGPVLAQASVAILPDDTEDTLHERIKAVEHPLLVQVVGRAAREGITVIDGKASIP